MNELVAILFADGVYIGGGVLVIIIVAFVLYLLLRRT